MNDLIKGLVESLKTGLLGMGITLVSLYILSFILDFMKVIFYKEEKNEATRESTVENEQTSETTKENEELVSVITAAVAAYLGKPVDQIKIGFIKRIHEKAPAWAMESRLNPKENP